MKRPGGQYPGPDKRQKRVKAFTRGKNAEQLAAWWLRLRGYRLVAWRYKTRFGEIDLIMRRGRTLVFIEVKARDSVTAGLEAISTRQQQRIRDAAEVFLARHQNTRTRTRAGRFDAVIVTPGRFGVPRVTHRKDAWR